MSESKAKQETQPQGYEPPRVDVIGGLIEWTAMPSGKSINYPDNHCGIPVGS